MKRREILAKLTGMMLAGAMGNDHGASHCTC